MRFQLTRQFDFLSIALNIKSNKNIKVSPILVKFCVHSQVPSSFYNNCYKCVYYRNTCTYKVVYRNTVTYSSNKR